MSGMLRLLSAALCCLFFVPSLYAQSLTWEGSKSNAVSLAFSQGKLVLLMAGRHTCSHCNYMQNTVCETNSPPIKQLIQGRYVPWFCVVDNSSEWLVYASGLGSFTLPLICCIDPANPDAYMDRTTDVQDVQVFYNRLLARVDDQMTNARINQFCITNGCVTLSLTNLVFGKTNHIERSFDLQSWTSIAEFVCTSRGTNWSESLNDGWAKAFYRISITK